MRYFWWVMFEGFFRALLLVILLFLVLGWLGALGCADIQRRPDQTIPEFCEDWAMMRPHSADPESGLRTFNYWYLDCLRREYRRGP